MRVSRVREYHQTDASDGFEWLYGDSDVWAGVWESDTEPPVPRDLTGWTVTVVFDPHRATVVFTPGRAEGGLDISQMVPDDAVPVRRVVATLGDQATEPGTFTFRMPGDIFPANPPADITQDVPVAIVYYEATRGEDSMQGRHLMIVRRGAP